MRVALGSEPSAQGSSHAPPRLDLIAAIAATPCAAEEMANGFVYLRDVDPTILQDMRYAGTDNFTGHAVNGYDAPECVLVREAAEALKAVQDEVKAKGLSLKVYDCYRPARAVKAFVDWSKLPTMRRRRRPTIRRCRRARSSRTISPSSRAIPVAPPWTLRSCPSMRRPCRQVHRQAKPWPARRRKGSGRRTRAWTWARPSTAST